MFITRHGKEVARLVPPSGTINRNAAAAAAQRVRDMSKGVTLRGLKIKDMMNEGAVDPRSRRVAASAQKNAAADAVLDQVADQGSGSRALWKLGLADWRLPFI